MGAGQPDWNRLHAMGKLSREQHVHVPLLSQLDSAESKLKEIEGGCCDSCRDKFFTDHSKDEKTVLIDMKCEVEGCDFVAHGKTEGSAGNGLRLHSKTHVTKE